MWASWTKNNCKEDNKLRNLNFIYCEDRFENGSSSGKLVVSKKYFKRTRKHVV